MSRSIDERGDARMGSREVHGPFGHSGVDALVTALEQHLAFVVGTAAASLPGGGPEWDAVLARYRVAPAPQNERARSVRALNLVRGALPGEVRAVVAALAAWARGELARVRGNSTVRAQPALAQLDLRFAALVDVEMRRYERMIGPASPPPPALNLGPSLGAIFTNATRTSAAAQCGSTPREHEHGHAHKHPYKQVENLTCVHCGGPQERPLDFTCKYCRRPIAGATRPTL